MFWNNVSFIYDAFENAYNKKANNRAVEIVCSNIQKDDDVLECACGTGIFTVGIAPHCRSITATDYAPKMLTRASDKCKKAGYTNCTFEIADITSLKYEDNSFDKVVAANVIHILDNPSAALKEFERIIRPGGMIIIPTYINMSKTTASFLVNVWNRWGANFKRQFDTETYKKFFEELGYNDVEFATAEGHMPCCVAIIKTAADDCGCNP